MMQFPPLPDPEQLLSETNEIAEATGLDQIMPRVGVFIAAFICIMDCAIRGECKDCACETCSRIRPVVDEIMLAAGADAAD